MWKKVLREYFAFPKKERRGLFVLFSCWLVLLGYYCYRSNEIRFLFIDSNYKIIVSEELKFRDAIRMDSIHHPYKSSNKNYRKYFKYLEEKDLIQYGLTKEQVQKIMLLRNNGLTIYTKLDLDNCGKLDTNMKIILQKNLKFFPEKKYFDKNFGLKKTVVKVDINLADTNEIDAIRGMSKSLSVRIIKYRERLGGFINIEQLKEVWGMDSLSYVQLQEGILLGQSIKKININSADIKALGAHPYIGYSLAKLIVNYRLQHGNYNKTEDLFRIHVMNADIFSKIEAYITTKDD